jgi:hypothetical protein
MLTFGLPLGSGICSSREPSSSWEVEFAAWEEVSRDAIHNVANMAVAVVDAVKDRGVRVGS